jgi:acetyl esterase/lipase
MREGRAFPMHRGSIYILFLLVLGGFAGPVVAEKDGITLFIEPGLDTDDVELGWTGGQPAFRIFRSTDAASLTSPAKQIAQTSDRLWTDTTPPGYLHFYRVTGLVTIETTTLSYGGNGAQSLDLYMPQEPPNVPMPTVVLAHGGLWQSGDKSALDTLCRNVVLQSGGTQACASINYRLSQNIGGVCSAPGVDTYSDQIVDMASAYALLQSDAGAYGLDAARMYVGGHSAGGHLSQELNLRWTDFEQSCSNPAGCSPAAGAIGFEGIYDISAWDEYDNSVWGGQFYCATRKAFGFPPESASHCVDSDHGLPCWDVGSPTYLAQNNGTLGIAPVGDALIIHSPGDTWVDIAEASNFGAAMSAAFPGSSSITSTDGTCATGQHNDPLSQVGLATCIVNFIASRGDWIW